MSAPHRSGPGPATAGWALGLALVGCALIGNLISTVLALRVLAHRRRTGEDCNHGLAVAALAINAATVGVLAIAGYVVLVFDDLGETDPAVAYKALPRVNADHTVISSLMEVDYDSCLSFSGTSEKEMLARIVTCDEEHDLEVYEWQYVEEDVYPGAAALERRAKRICEGKEFEDYVGIPLRDSELEVAWGVPTPEEWDYYERLLVCLVSDPAGPLSESLLFAKR